MARRFYICGSTGTGTPYDPIRPEMADEVAALDPSCAWVAVQEMLPGVPAVPGDRFIVALASDDPDIHAALAYDAAANPNGYDWFEVMEDGSVVVNAA